MSSSTLSSPTPSSRSVAKKTRNAPTRRRYHNASAFYLFCKAFVAECAENGRRFRTNSHGFEAAALRWNELASDEKQQWRDFCKKERKRSKEMGTEQTLKMRNGDGGDPRCDPTELGTIKDLDLKRERDVAELKSRWMWNFSGDEEALRCEWFFIVTAKVNYFGSCPDVKELAFVQFSLGMGLMDELHVQFDVSPAWDTVATKYEAIRRILDWPLKSGRRLHGSAPVFFAPVGQLSTVFDALTFVDPSTSAMMPWNEENNQLNLIRDISTVKELRAALSDWFRKPQSGSEDLEQAEEENCLETACRCAIKMIESVF